MVKVGSVFENNNVTFLVETGDETPTGYAGIAVSTAFYIYYDETAGAFIFDSTTPVWNDALQGWYNGNDRALFSMFKDSGGTLYEGKRLIPSYSEERYYHINSDGDENDLYDVLSTWVPAQSDSLKCDGALIIGTIPYFITGIIKGASIVNVIVINSGGTSSVVVINDSDATVIKHVEIRSNYSRYNLA